MKINIKETKEYKDKMNLIKEIIIILLVILFIGLSSFEIYLDINNLKFMTKEEKSSLLEVLKLGEFNESFKPLSFEIKKNGFGRDNEYKVLKFIISEVDYKKNNLNYKDIDTTEVNKTIKTLNNTCYECTISINKDNLTYEYKSFDATSKANYIIRYSLAIVLIIMFIVIIRLIREVIYYTSKN